MKRAAMVLGAIWFFSGMGYLLVSFMAGAFGYDTEISWWFIRLWLVPFVWLVLAAAVAMVVVTVRDERSR